MSGSTVNQFSPLHNYGINPHINPLAVPAQGTETLPQNSDSSPAETSPPIEQNGTQRYERHSSQPTEVDFSFHQNDVTVMAATRRGELAVSWLSQTISGNWGEDETLDQVLDRVSRMDNEKVSHHPTIFRSTQNHQPIGEQHTLIFANSDYNEDGDFNDLNDLESVVSGTADLEQAYATHGYQTEFHSNTSSAEMYDSIEEQLNAMEPGDELVVHYAGHGSANGAALGTESARDRFNPLHAIRKMYDLDQLNNSQVQELVDLAQDRGIKLVMIIESCESGYTTDYVRHRELAGLGNQIESMTEGVSENDRPLLDAARSNYRQAEQLLEQVDHLTSEEPLVFEIDGETHRVPMDESQAFLWEQSAIITMNPELSQEEKDAKQQVMRDVISQRDSDIQSLEYMADDLMGLAYEQLMRIEGFDFSDSQINPNQLRFSTGTSVGFQSGAMLEARMDYNLVEYSRDRGLGLAFSAGVGTGDGIYGRDAQAPHFKLTEALVIDRTTRFSTEVGFAQTFDTEGDFTFWAHLGASYDVTEDFTLAGGLDIALEDADSVEQVLNPYLGARFNF